MSSVLHPVGPEPAQTYWVRRAVVIGVAVVVLAILVALVVDGTSSGSAVQQQPPTLAPAVQTTPTVTPTTSASPSPTAATASPTATPSATPRAAATTSPVACPADQLRVTLTGKQRLKPKQKNRFHLSVINGSSSSCLVAFDGDSFELKIYSGTDRIWTSDHCGTAVKAVRRKLAAERSVEWEMLWNGKRSRPECKSRPETPRPGTYFATAQLKDADPVQLRMILVG